MPDIKAITPDEKEVSKATEDMLIIEPDKVSELDFQTDSDDLNVGTPEIGSDEEGWIDDSSEGYIIETFAKERLKDRLSITTDLKNVEEMVKHSKDEERKSKMLTQLNHLSKISEYPKLNTWAINDTEQIFDPELESDKYLITNFHAPPAHLDKLIDQEPTISYDDFLDNLTETFYHQTCHRINLQDILKVNDEVKKQTNGLIIYKLSKYGFYRRRETEEFYQFLLEQGLKIGQKYCFNEHKYPNAFELYTHYFELLNS